MPLERLIERFSEEDQPEEEQPVDETTPDFAAGNTDGSGGEGIDSSGPAPDGGAAASQGGSTGGSTDYRVDELEDHVEQNAQALENVEQSQTEIAESVEEMNDTVRQLLGMYSQVTAAENPFVEDDGDGFGVVQDLPEDGETDDASSEDATADAGPESDRADEEADAVSFEDLASAQEQDPTRSESELDVQTDDHTPTEVAETVPPTQETERPEEVEAISEDTTRTSGSLLPALPEGYAAEVVVFEWLSMLVTTTGPAAALKALAYYEEVGWISSEVREHLDMALSGPDLDIHVDPNNPTELTASDHAESYAYIKQLRELEQMEVSFAE